MKKTVFLIFIFSFFIRILFISKIPLSINWDEATFGYNAFSILHTLRDEYGVLLPLQFKSVGDYKAPMYVYTLVPSIAIFGLNEFSVRLIPALFGSFAICFFYLIVKNLFNKKIATYSSFFLSITPWHIQFTRAGADVGVSTFFVLGGIYFSVLHFKENKKRLVYSYLFFALSMYSYFADRLFVPLIALSFLLIFNGKNLYKFITKNYKAFIWGFVFMIPILTPLFSKGHREKITKTTILSQSRSIEYIQYLKNYSMDNVTYEIFHNKFYELGMGIADRYLAHFSPNFLFSYGANYDGRQMIFRMGVLYVFQLPLIFLGFIALFRHKNKKVKYLLLSWLILAPIPAAITNDSVHARRSFNMVYPYSVITGIGFAYLFDLKINKFLKKVIILTFVPLFFVNIIFYIFSYSVFTPNRTYVGSAGWQWGYKELVSRMEKYENKYSKIVIDTSYQGPYIYFLFYKKYAPYSYQPQARLIQSSPFSLGEGAGFDNYEFRPIYWPDDRKTDKIIFAGPPERIPLKDIDSKESRILEEILFPNGEVAYLIVETY